MYRVPLVSLWRESNARLHDCAMSIGAALNGSCLYRRCVHHPFVKELFVSQHPDDAGLHIRLHLKTSNGGLIVIRKRQGDRRGQP